MRAHWRKRTGCKVFWPSHNSPWISFDSPLPVLCQHCRLSVSARLGSAELQASWDMCHLIRKLSCLVFLLHFFILKGSSFRLFSPFLFYLSQEEAWGCGCCLMVSSVHEHVTSASQLAFNQAMPLGCCGHCQSIVAIPWSTCSVFQGVFFFFYMFVFVSCAIYFTVEEENLELYFTGWLEIPWIAGWSCLSSLLLRENTCFLSQFSYETIPAF